MLILLVAGVGLLVGPLLDHLASSKNTSRSAINGVLIGLMVGFLGLEVFPASLETAGLGALALATLGLLTPIWLRRLSSWGGKSVTAVLAIIGLLIHSLLDGWIIRQHSATPSSETLALGLAIVVHRVPIGAVLWRLLRQPLGRNAAIGGLLLLGMFTAIGYSIGGQPILSEPAMVNACVQAFMAGLLLHVIFEPDVKSTRPATSCQHSSCEHKASDDAVDQRAVSFEALGFCLGIAATYLAASAHHHSSLEEEFGRRLTALWLETSPALLIGFLGAGFISVLLPEAPAQWVRRGNRLSQALRGVIFGLPLPICSCSVIPIYRSLLTRNFPTPAALAFLVAAPELGLESILLTIPLLGASFTLYRVLAAAVLAVAAAYIVSRWMPQLTTSAPHPLKDHHHHHHGHDHHHHHHSFPSQWREALRFAFVNVVDDVAAWICIGLVVAASIPQNSLTESIALVPSGLHVPLAALIGIPMYVCASGATPIAAALIAGGLSPGAGLAFLLAGPSTNVTTFGLLRSLHGTTVATRFGLTMIFGATLIGWLADLLFVSRTSLTLPKLEAESFSLLAYLSAIVIGLLFTMALFRQGPRALVRH